MRKSARMQRAVRTRAHGHTRAPRWLACIVSLLFLCPSLFAQGTGLVFTPRDQLLGIPLASTPFSGSELPPAVDLSPDLPPPGNQGSQQSCVGWAVAYALKSFQERAEENWPLSVRSGVPDPAHVFSPAFVYNQINNGRDGGCSLPDALNLLHEKGAVTLALMPYDPKSFRKQPDAAAAENATRYRIDYWRQVNVSDPREIKAQLNAGYPVIIGAEVDQGFVKARTGVIWKSVQGRTLGGHAMVLVGYDDRRHAFKLLNSWGRDWGDAGYGWIDYDFIKKVVNEAYVAKDALNGPSRTVDAGPTPAPTPAPTPTPKPVPAPVASRVSFQVTNIIHNVTDASGTNWMRLEGMVSIPPGLGRSVQIVVHFYHDTGGGLKGLPVGSTATRFSDINGFAATGTQPVPIPAEGMSVSWWAVIPYGAMVLQSGGWQTDLFGNSGYVPVQNQLVLEPVLYVDGFGIATGGALAFFVVR